MKKLIIDTSKDTIRVALEEEAKILAERIFPRDRSLGTQLLSTIDDLIGKTSLPSCIEVNEGAGHFMAVRTGTVTAQLLAQAWKADFRQTPLTSP